MTSTRSALCSQEYQDCTTMVVTACDRCTAGWDRKLRRCTIATGAEHLPDEIDVPVCPIQDRCQHQLQSSVPCLVRRKGLICESALIYAGMSEEEAAEHPLAFNATVVITPEELEKLGCDRR